MSENWNDLMARCIGWVPNPDRPEQARTYVLDDGEHIALTGGTLAVPAEQCPHARQMTVEEAHELWATVYVPGPKYQTRLAYHEGERRKYVAAGKRARGGGAS